MMDLKFKFHKEAKARELMLESMPYSEWKNRYEAGCPTTFDICARCGVEHEYCNDVWIAFESIFSFKAVALTDLHKRHDNTSINDGEFWISYPLKHFELPCSSDICKRCFAEISPALMSYRDVCELDLSITYLERAISCRKSFLKHKVKSKQQANLERCLSMPQRVFSMETWTWTELPQSTVLQKT